MTDWTIWDWLSALESVSVIVTGALVSLIVVITLWGAGKNQ